MPPGGRAPLPRWRRVFPGRDDQVRKVRRWLTALLPGAPERDDVVLVAVELVTNAIRHTGSGRGGLVMVEVAWCGPVLRIAVADDGAPGGPRLAADSGGLAECGRGLHLDRPEARRAAAATAAAGRPPPVGARPGAPRRGDQAAHGRAECAVAAVPASRPATAHASA